MLVSLGKVTIATPGVLKRATENNAVPSSRFLCHSVMIEVWPENSGKIYICDRSDADKSTGYGLVAILGIPTENSMPSFVDTITGAIAGINLELLWIDSEVGGDGVIVSAEVP